MATLRSALECRHLNRPEMDADSAFNDGFRLRVEAGRHTLLRWALMIWSIVAWFIGSYVLAAAFFTLLNTVWIKISTAGP